MNDLPSYVSKKHLTFFWLYQDANREPIAMVIRYDEPSRKKRFHQHHRDEKGKWVEGAPTPLPLFGIHSLPKTNYDGFVCIFEGEKCCEAAHHLNLPAITSMMGSSQGHLADWAQLAQYRHCKKFTIFPDNDDPGRRYADKIISEIRRACPYAEISVCYVSTQQTGNDFVDWIKTQPHCPLDWNGFASLDEPYNHYLRLAFEDFVANNQVSAETFSKNIKMCPIMFESDPEPIEEILSKVLPCPVHTLPSLIREWMEEIADQMQIPIDYLVAPFLVSIGSLIGRKCALRMRPGINWIEFPNLWGMIIGRPSLMKSPAMEAMLVPLLKLSNRALKDYEGMKAIHTNNLELWKIRKKTHEEAYKKNYKDSLVDPKRTSNSISPFEESELKEPMRKRYKTDDPTVEKLGELLIDNPQGLLLFRDELNGWLRSFDKMGRENDRQFYLESWSGKKDFDVDRIGRGSLHVPALMISIFGSIQPGPLSQYIKSAVKGGDSDDGFIQRFQVVVWPDFASNFEIKNTPLSVDKEKKVNQLFEFLDQLPFNLDGKTITIEFDEEAQQVFDEWQYNLENRLRKKELPAHIEAHFAKYKKLIASLCLIIEHINMALSECFPAYIGAETIKIAIQWINYFESHALRIYGSSINAIPKAAKELLEHIKKGDLIQPFTIRDVYHKHHWSGMATPNEVEEVLEFLTEKGYLGLAVVQTNGRPSRKYWWHPKIMETD
ncbi:MAG: DUF3987 domain-containing protein [Chlamydiales bacterium]